MRMLLVIKACETKGELSQCSFDEGKIVTVIMGISKIGKHPSLAFRKSNLSFVSFETYRAYNNMSPNTSALSFHAFSDVCCAMRTLQTHGDSHTKIYMTKTQMNLCLGHFMCSVMIIETDTVKTSSAMTEGIKATL